MLSGIRAGIRTKMRFPIRKGLGALLAAIVGVACVAAHEPPFERDVKPIFQANCFSCHGGTAMIGLDLRTAASILQGSHQGPVVVPGLPQKSLLYQKVASRAMPPPAFALKLTDAEIETIRKWIEAGVPSEEGDANQKKLQAEQVRFEREILPILRSRCFACHGTDNPMAGLDLRTVESVLKGSANGPVISEGGSDKSILIRMISTKSMPPPGTAEPLSEPELEKLRQWVDTLQVSPRMLGVNERATFTKVEAREVTAKDRELWAFRKPIKPPVPQVKNQKRVRTPIDAFVLAKLEAKGLTFSADAPGLVLMRRAQFDLVGLPPAPEQIVAFQGGSKPGAYEGLIDNLLASPHYGERWARHWLDVAGYTDVQLYDNSPISAHLFDGIWRYRDYVVRSLNAGKPYDRFLMEQIAGDELVDWRSAKKYTPEILDSLVATGFLRSVYDRTDPDIVNLPGERYDVLFHLLDKFGTGVMGLTLNCARCHSHKFDPIPQRDYYRFLSIFAPAYNPANWLQPKNRHLSNVPKLELEEIKKHNAEIDQRASAPKQKLERLRRPYKERLLEVKLEKLPAEIRAEAKDALATPEDNRDAVQKFLVMKFQKTLEVKPEEMTGALSPEHKAAATKLEEQIKLLESYRRPTEKLQALWDVGPPPKMRLLQRGEVEAPGPPVQPGFLTILSPPGKSDLVKPPDLKGESSGNRLAMARWLTSRDHPLTARVIVNRVWQHHFGRGIVATPDNFGRQGSPPTHPELLDWLAVDFMDHGWGLKRLHKLIMTSTVYRQASRQPAEGKQSAALAVDPENKLLWRMNLRRLEAEAIRDAVLAASGKLDRTMGGAPIFAPAIADGFSKLQDAFTKSLPIPTEGEWRRSLYLFARRYYPHTFLEVFDSPIMQTNCTRRLNSVSPLQSLTLLNDDFMVESADYLADQVSGVAREGKAAQLIEAAYLLTLSRPPTVAEKELAQALLQDQEELHRRANMAPDKAAKAALANLCHMLLASNEFLYIE